MLPKKETLVSNRLRKMTMNDINIQFRTGRATALFFILLSGVSAAATTVMPLVIQA